MDGQNIRGPINEPRGVEEAYAWRTEDNDFPRYVWPQRTEVHVDQIVQDAFARADAIHEEIAADLGEPADFPNEASFLNQEKTIADLGKLIGESTQPIYEGCSVNRLQASIVVLNMVNIFGVPYSFLDELLRFLAADLLPQSNCLLRTTYDMKSILMKMGLEHEAIHCCSSGHVLYEGPENGDLQQCPNCGEPRFVSGSNTIPKKVLRYFPIIPHLQRLFQCPEVAQLLKWHASNKSVDEYMRSVVDSQQWASIDAIDPSFKQEERNLYLGMVADGVNPFGNQSTKYSMWPVLLVMYNLPSWLVAKKFFISLTILIPGDKAPNGESFDVFIAPLVRDLLALWGGIQTLDSSSRDGRGLFLLRAILLWTMNDFPAYGLISGQQTKGYRGCPVCVTETCAIHSNILKKMLYLGHRHY